MLFEKCIKNKIYIIQKYIEKYIILLKYVNINRYAIPDDEFWFVLRMHTKRTNKQTYV